MPQADNSLETNITILYIEDDFINQTVLKGLLGMLGYTQVMMAADAKSALELLANPPQAIDVIFMDLGLPDMDGITLTEKIRHSDFKAKSVPIIALTGNVAAVAREKSLAVGMNGFLGKPITSAELRQVLVDVLAQ